MKMASRLVAALAAAAMLLVGGCAANNPRVAATVGSVTIMESQVDGVAAVLADSTDGQRTAGSLRAGVLTVMIQSVLVLKAAAEKGVVVTQAERDAMFASEPSMAVLRENPVTAQFITDFVDSSLASSRLGQEAFAAIALAVPVTVNPRYGSWNQNLAQLTGESGSLSQLVPTTAAAK